MGNSYNKSQSTIISGLTGVESISRRNDGAVLLIISGASSSVAVVILDRNATQSAVDMYYMNHFGDTDERLKNGISPMLGMTFHPGQQIWSHHK